MRAKRYTAGGGDGSFVALGDSIVYGNGLGANGVRSTHARGGHAERTTHTTPSFLLPTLTAPPPSRARKKEKKERKGGKEKERTAPLDRGDVYTVRGRDPRSQYP